MAVMRGKFERPEKTNFGHKSRLHFGEKRLLKRKTFCGRFRVEETLFPGGES